METIQELLKIDFSYVFISVFALLAGGKTVICLFEWIVDKSGIETKWMRNRRKNNELLRQTADSLISLQNQQTADRKLSMQHDKWIKEDLSKLSNTVDDIALRLDNMKKETEERLRASENKENKRVQAEIKHKIAHSYRRYHTSQKITKMEFETLEDLIETYENYGGKNSFVHSVVQKEMYKWEQI